MVNLDGIEVFVKVIQAGSFTKAASLLNLPTTTVSDQITRLEKRLGVTLIHRTTRKLNITQEGEVFFQHCRRALEEVEAGHNELNFKKLEPEGLLRITAPADLGHSILRPIVREYLKTFKKTNVELILTNRIVDLVGEGVDLGLRTGTLKNSALLSRKFFASGMSLWASPAYIKKYGEPSRPEQLSAHEFIRFLSSFDTLNLTSRQKSQSIKIQGRLNVDDMEAAKIFALDGDGIGILPNFLCTEEANSKKLIRVLPQWGVRNFGFYFIYPPQRFVPPKVQEFITLALKHVGGHDWR